jgi:hypothetical protein
VNYFTPVNGHPGATARTIVFVGIGRKSAEWRRAEADLAFLEHLRDADVGTLKKMARDHELAPQWKRVAIARAVMRHERASDPSMLVSREIERARDEASGPTPHGARA